MPTLTSNNITLTDLLGPDDWRPNTGTAPVFDDDRRIDLLLRDGTPIADVTPNPNGWNWRINGYSSDIAVWRYHQDTPITGVYRHRTVANPWIPHTANDPMPVVRGELVMIETPDERQTILPATIVDWACDLNWKPLNPLAWIEVPRHAIEIPPGQLDQDRHPIGWRPTPPSMRIDFKATHHGGTLYNGAFDSGATDTDGRPAGYCPNSFAPISHWRPAQPHPWQPHDGSETCPVADDTPIAYLLRAYPDKEFRMDRPQHLVWNNLNTGADILAWRHDDTADVIVPSEETGWVVLLPHAHELPAELHDRDRVDVILRDNESVRRERLVEDLRHTTVLAYRVAHAFRHDTVFALRKDLSHHGWYQALHPLFRDCSRNGAPATYFDTLAALEEDTCPSPLREALERIRIDNAPPYSTSGNVNDLNLRLVRQQLRAL